MALDVHTILEGNTTDEKATPIAIIQCMTNEITEIYWPHDTSISVQFL